MKSLFFLIIVVSCFSLSACGGNANAESLFPESEITLLHKNNYVASGTLTIKQSKVISSTVRYHSELLRYSSDNPTDINFSHNKVLLVDMGDRRSGGYFISLDNSRLLVGDDTVTVTVVLTVPGNGCNVSFAATNPYAFYRIPTQKEVLIQEKLVIKNCN
jgi:hypothetical protein